MPSKVHDICDDFQSVFWVILYISFRYFQHAARRGFIEDWNDMFVEQRHSQLSRINPIPAWIGGRLKREFMINNRASDIAFTSGPLQTLVEEMTYGWAEYAELYDRLHLPLLSKVFRNDLIAELQIFKEQLSESDYWVDMLHKALHAEGWTEDALKKEKYQSNSTSMDHEQCDLPATGATNSETTAAVSKQNPSSPCLSLPTAGTAQAEPSDAMHP
jgi:hypothetical protein